MDYSLVILEKGGGGKSENGEFKEQQESIFAYMNINTFCACLGRIG